MFAQPVLAEDWTFESRTLHAADWSGAYAGTFGGIGITAGQAVLGDYSGVLLPADVAYGLFPQSIERNSFGGLFGFAAGMNFQSGSFVGGVKADIGYAAATAHHSFSRLDDTHVVAPFDINTNTDYTTRFGALGTLRVRGGYAFGDTMVFGTAGLAAGHVHNRFELALPEIGYTSPDWSGSGLRIGYTVGLGFEHRVTDTISLEFETLFVDLADQAVEGTDSVAFPGESIAYRFTNTMIVPRFGLNVRF